MAATMSVKTCQSLMGVQIRRLSTTTSSQTSKAASKYARKFLIGDKNKRRVWHAGGLTPGPVVKAQKPGGGVSTQRLTVLDKVFFQTITDIMATGNVSQRLVGLGLEVSKVRVLPNMGGLNVYWICAGTPMDARVEAILHSCAHDLRHEVSQLRILGHVPPITFVKDERYYKMAEVEKRLSEADFGEDFEPTDPSHHVKVKLVSNTPLDDHIKAELMALGVGSAGAAGVEELPVMRADVLGVDTARIFNMVREGQVRAEAAHRKNKSKDVASVSSEPGSVLARGTEIRRWVDQYKARQKQQRRQNNKEHTLLSSPPLYASDDTPDLDYVEERDFLEEDEGQI